VQFWQSWDVEFFQGVTSRSSGARNKVTRACLVGRALFLLQLLVYLNLTNFDNDDSA
jgi:hypothetical protein